MRPRSIASIIAVALFAGACADTTAGMDAGPAVGSGAGPTAVGPVAPGTVGGEQQVPEILDFEATLVGGGTIRGAELAGAPVAVWFWAPW